MIDIYVAPLVGGWAVMADHREAAGIVPRVMEAGLSLERAFRIAEWTTLMDQGRPAAN
ncbi:hypothetical protein [Azospirillum sp. SYSU D00513]|uniref:hypothetical protein n=1 Tax=Azospirillum sp. SYSU D00513 TaxID=2812561 RepID=UPI001A95DD07|nr:hypothetical protein [Azospirillum sp. SYSU D00513]